MRRTILVGICCFPGSGAHVDLDRSNPRSWSGPGHESVSQALSALSLTVKRLLRVAARIAIVVQSLPRPVSARQSIAERQSKLPAPQRTEDRGRSVISGRNRVRARTKELRIIGGPCVDPELDLD